MMVFLHHGAHALGSLGPEPIFRLRDQPAGDSLAPVLGMHRHPVYIAPPTVEGPDDGTYDPAAALGN